MICIIPARGGSERLPGKNIADFFGVPIIYHAIKAAQDAKIFDKIVVSTDSADIAHVVDGLNCDFHMRPVEFSGDVAEADVLINCAEGYRENQICRIYPFATLLTAERLEYGYRLYSNKYLYGYDTVMECQRYAHPPQRGFTLDHGRGQYLRGKNVMKRTQDLQPVYHDAGTFMFTDTDALKKPLDKQEIKWIEVKETEAQDVDTEEDLELARAKFLMRRYGR